MISSSLRLGRKKNNNNSLKFCSVKVYIPVILYFSFSVLCNKKASIFLNIGQCVIKTFPLTKY